jgi:outer membrane protein TolC
MHRLLRAATVVTLLLGWQHPGFGDTLTLESVIARAQQRSTSAALARNRFRASYWQFRTSAVAFQPTLTLQATTVDFGRTISKLSLPDGTEAFVPQSSSTSGFSLSMSKVIRTTGGEVFLETALERLDELDHATAPSYLAHPVRFGLRQPLFAFNPHRWQERIEPIRYEEARRQYLEDLEGIGIAAAQSFFDLLAARDRLRVAGANGADAETLHVRTIKRRKAGRASEEDLVETELGQLNARLELQQAELDAAARLRAFRSYLGDRDTSAVDLDLALEAPDVNVDAATAVAFARAHRSDALALERRKLEAERDVADARAAGGMNASLVASYGRSQTTGDLHDIFRRGQEFDQASLTLQVPILDWGRAQAHAKVADSNHDVTLISIEQSRADLDQDVVTKVDEFNVQRERIRLAERADALAERHHEAVTKRYLAGQADLESVNLALAQKDLARRNHVEALRGYWTSYLELRRATLFDFMAGRAIEPVDLAW